MINNAITTLISAVRPLVKPDVLDALTATVAQKGNISLFALSTLTTVLEAQESLLDTKDHSREGDAVVSAGAAAAYYQQIQNADISNPIINIVS